MRNFILAVAGAALLAAVAPAAAGPLTTDMSSQIRVEGPGVGVRIGDDRRRDDHRRWESRERRMDRHGRWDSRRSRRDDCRTVVVRDRRSDGSVVVRKRTTCD